MKGISAIISIVLVLMITVSIAGLAYMFLFKLTTNTTGTIETRIKNVSSNFLAKMKVESMSANIVYVRNMGQTDISGITVLVNNVVYNVNVTPSVIKAGGVGTIKILDFLKKDDDIKIFSTQGASASLKASDPCEQAVLCLNFDEGQGTTTVDSSDKGNNGVYIGESFNDGTINGAARVDGKYGKALKFDGLNDYLNAPMSSGPGYSNKTIMFWYKIPGGNNPDNYEVMEWSGVFTLFKQGANDWQLYAFNSSHGIRFRNFDFVTSGDDAWRFKTIVIGYDSAKQPKYVEDYTNGVLIERKTTPDYFSSGQSFGNFYVASTPYPSGIYFNGTIDEVRVWNRSLNEIEANKNSALPISRTVASWSFEEYGTYANDTHIWVKGTNGAALSFDGSDDYVQIPDSPSLDITNAVTVMAWVKLNNVTAPQQRIFNRIDLDNSNGFSLEFDYSSILFWVYINGIGWQKAELTGCLADTWYYIIGTYDGNTIRVFRNMVEGTPYSYSGTIGKPSDPITRIAYNQFNPPSNGLNGTIDEVRVYNRAVYS